MGTRLLVGVEGLELDIVSLRLCVTPWLCDVDDPDALLVELGHLAPFDEWSRQGQGGDDVDEAFPEAELLEAGGLGDADG
jgi:hypothetical protein